MVHTVYTYIPDPHVYTVHIHRRHVCIDLYQHIPVYMTRRSTYINIDRFIQISSCIYLCDNRQIFYKCYKPLQIDGYDTVTRRYTTYWTLLYLPSRLQLVN
jgi:hypothetical protein